MPACQPPFNPITRCGTPVPARPPGWSGTYAGWSSASRSGRSWASARRIAGRDAGCGVSRWWWGASSTPQESATITSGRTPSRVSCSAPRCNARRVPPGCRAPRWSSARCTRRRRHSRRGSRSGELTCRRRWAKLLCDADLRVQVPGRACVRQVLPDDEQQSPREVPYLREDGGAADLGRVRVGVQGLRLLHNRLQAGRREAGGDGGHEARGRVQAQPRVEAQLRGEAQRRVEACGRDEARRARQEEKRLRRQVKAHEVIRAALADAAARLGVSVSAGAIELERPRDPAHGDVATNLALTLAKSLKQKPRAVAERLVAGLALPQGLVRKIDVAGPGFINFHLAEAQLASMLEAVLEAS